MSQFGKLYGAGHLISAMIGSVQYGLFTVAEDTLEKDPFWVRTAAIVYYVGGLGSIKLKLHEMICAYFLITKFSLA